MSVEKPTWQILVCFALVMWPFLRLFSWGNGRLGKHSRNSYFVLKKKTNRLTKQSNGEKLCIDLSGNTKYFFFFERQQNKKISWTSAVLRFMKHSLYFFERFFAIRKGRFRVLFSVKRNASYIWLYDRKRSTIGKRSSFGFLRRRFFHDTFTNETKKRMQFFYFWSSQKTKVPLLLSGLNLILPKKLVI